MGQVLSCNFLFARVMAFALLELFLRSTTFKRERLGAADYATGLVRHQRLNFFPKKILLLQFFI